MNKRFSSASLSTADSLPCLDQVPLKAKIQKAATWSKTSNNFARSPYQLRSEIELGLLQTTLCCWFFLLLPRLNQSMPGGFEPAMRAVGSFDWQASSVRESTCSVALITAASKANQSDETCSLNGWDCLVAHVSLLSKAGKQGVDEFLWRGRKSFYFDSSVRRGN